MTAATADEFEELITDDPRVEVKDKGTLAQLKQWRQITKEHGGLVSPKQVSVLVGVSPSVITAKMKKGHFTTYELFGLKCIPMDQVVLYMEQRNTDSLAKGGSGLKAPNYWDLLQAS